MNIVSILLAVLLFSVIVIFHELGHFTLAKLNGIRVDEFSLGLGPTLFGKEFHGTKFSLKLLPFGGACMMGEDDAEDVSAGSFNSKSVWARMSVIVAGPVFNFIMALVVSIIIVAWTGYDEPVLSGITEGQSAQEQGLKEGDRITEINGKSIHIWREIALYNALHQGEEATFTYERNNKEYTAVLEPTKVETTDGAGYYYYGVQGGANTKANFFKALEYGAYELKYWVCYTFDCLKMLVTGQVGIGQLSGPVGIVDYVGETVKQSSPYGALAVLGSLLNFVILLSANLGVMNLLPLPALDGGRLVFLIIEAIRGRRVNPEREGMVHFVGLVCLLLLMVVVMYHDIVRIF
ncbi:MAG: RIP metalloprotease RseP [Hespellia sp.]|nr:RIP metalloprotease RseP [Hespellia sp.]